MAARLANQVASQQQGRAMQGERDRYEQRLRDYTASMGVTRPAPAAATPRASEEMRRPAYTRARQNLLGAG